MDLKQAYARRASWAFKRLQQNEWPEKISQADLGSRVGKRVKETFTPQAVAGWLNGALPRNLETMEALAVELDVLPEWLYFNRGAAPAGWIDPKEAHRDPRDKMDAPAHAASKRKASGQR